MLRWVVDAKFMGTKIEIREFPDKALVFTLGYSAGDVI